VISLLKPQAVPPDAQVAVVSPASTPQPDRVESGLEALRALGYDPQASEHILARGPLYFAGTPEMRLHDLHHAFADEEAHAIFSTRGGYGSNYLLERPDRSAVVAAGPDSTARVLWTHAVRGFCA
jgi:muramoyltetrapeptide carboxypeptidase